MAQPRKMRRRSSNCLGEQLRSLIDSPEGTDVDADDTQNDSNFSTEMVEDDTRPEEEMHYEIEEQVVEEEGEGEVITESIQHQIEQIEQTDIAEDCEDETVIYEIINDI